MRFTLLHMLYGLLCAAVDSADEWRIRFWRWKDRVGTAIDRVEREEAARLAYGK